VQFPISTPRELLEKGRRELERLETAAEGTWGEPDETQIADLTINVAWSLWHVTDWIAHASPEVVRTVMPRQMNKAPRDRAQRFQQRLRALSHDLRLCWGLALRFKHFEIETEEARDMFEDERLSIGSALKPVVITALGLSGSSIPIFSSTPAPLHFSARPAGSIAGPSSYTLHPKVTYRKQRMRLTEVYRRAYGFLDQLLKKQGL
jgi:hypothetical protein